MVKKKPEGHLSRSDPNIGDGQSHPESDTDAPAGRDHPQDQRVPHHHVLPRLRERDAAADD